MSDDSKKLRQEWEQIHEDWSTEDFVQGDESELNGETISGQFMIYAERESDGKRVAGGGETPESALKALTTVVIREG
jgi:hypothetical protein